MESLENSSGHGILNFKESTSKYTLTRYLPGENLAEFIKHYWVVRWDLKGQPPYEQTILSHPNVNLVLQEGMATVFGVSQKTSSHLLKDKGVVLGVKFMSGGFYPFWKSSLTKLVGSFVPAKEVFGEEVDQIAIELESYLNEENDDEKAVKCVETMFQQQIPAYDPNGEFVNKAVQVIIEHPDFTRVDDVAQHVNTSVRTLQRLFNRYIGVSPKWVIQRYRLHEAAEQVEKGDIPDWTNLALRLGYYDQAHFIRDFKAIVGKPPGSYVHTIR